MAEDSSSTTNTNPLLLQSTITTISPLEQQVLDEYTRLSNNMTKLADALEGLASGKEIGDVSEGLRSLERKTASVYTLMKASVYSIVLQQGIGDE